MKILINDSLFLDFGSSEADQFVSEKRRWIYFDREGWRDASEDALLELELPLHSQISVAGFRRNENIDEWECLQLVLTPTVEFFNRVNSSLSGQKNRSRSKPMEKREWHLWFCVWMYDQIRGNLAESGVNLGPYETRRDRAFGELTRNRFEALRAAISMDESTFRGCVDDLRLVLHDMIVPGKILAIDETIISSESTSAGHHGFLKYIPGKPWPKGYFCHMGCVKLLLSQSVLVLDVEFKFGFNSLSMTGAAQELVHRLESTFGEGFIALCDSGYAAGTLLATPPPGSKTRYICSVSTAKVSGPFRVIAEKANALLPIGLRVVWYNTKLNLMAVIRRTKEYTFCLLTNCTRPVNAGDPVPALRALTWNQAFALYDVFTVPEMVRLLQFPEPNNASNIAESPHPVRYLKRVTGVDLASPLDGEGFVTKATLTPLSMDHVKVIAEENGINKQKGKAELINRILQVHPKAKHEPDPEIQSEEDEDSEGVKALKAKVTALKRQLEALKERFCRRSEEPSYEKLYLGNYGLEDRWNSDMYATFTHSNSKSPEQKIAWLYFYICLANARSIRHELVLQKMAKSTGKTPTLADQKRTRQTLGKFCLNVFDILLKSYDF